VVENPAPQPAPQHVATQTPAPQPAATQPAVVQPALAQQPQTTAEPVAVTPAPAPPRQRDPDAEFNDLLKQGKRALGSESFKKALGLYRKALSLKPDNDEAKVGAGMALVNSDPNEAGYKEAISLLKDGLKGGQSRNARAWVALGMAYQFTDQNSQAAPAYRKYLELEPRGPLAEDVKAMLEGL
jgi:Flp pilus assembly protein TadD